MAQYFHKKFRLSSLNIEADILLKTPFSLVILAVLSVACHSVKQTTGSTTHSSISAQRVEPKSYTSGSKRVYKGEHPLSGEQWLSNAGERSGIVLSGDIENSSRLQFKYALLTDSPVEAWGNMNLLTYIDDWYGVRYKYGGSSKSGVDCSAFSMGLLAFAYGITVPRTVKEQYGASRRIDIPDLRQGDLVFFNTAGGISHVGIYLLNNKFVHAATSGGVMISDLGEDYFLRRYVGAGRMN